MRYRIGQGVNAAATFSTALRSLAPSRRQRRAGRFGRGLVLAMLGDRALDAFGNRVSMAGGVPTLGDALLVLLNSLQGHRYRITAKFADNPIKVSLVGRSIDFPTLDYSLDDLVGDAGHRARA